MSFGLSTKAGIPVRFVLEATQWGVGFSVESSVLKPTRGRRLLNIVGPSVRVLRSEKGLSQAAFAARCQIGGLDISRDTVANIELRRRVVSDIEIEHLAEILGVGILDLFRRNRPR